MDDSQLPAPHNNFFQFAFSHVSAVRSLVQTHLPTQIVQLLDLNSFELQKDSFVDNHLRDSYSDLLYSVLLAGKEGAICQGQLYVLLEHKSHPDQMTCFQLVRYIVRIWEQRQRNGQVLCPIIPLVLYHGESEWSAPRSLDELIGTPDAILQYGLRFAFPVLDLGQIPDEDLAQDPFLQSALSLLKYSRRVEIENRLEAILRGLLELKTDRILKDYLNAIVTYLLATSPSLQMESVSMTIDKLFPTQIEPGSIADRLLKKGREEGRDQGLLEGEIKLIRTLQEILGMGVTDVSNLQGRSLEQLQNLALELRKQIQNRTP